MESVQPATRRKENVLRAHILLSVLVLLSRAALAAPLAVDPAMLELADRSRCLTCHDLDETVRGPAWRDVARRYRGKPEVEDALVSKVHEGGGGAWGNDYMSANKRVGLENIRVLVRWILALP